MDGTVANARLLSLTIERFKSYKEATTIELSPLTVILGKNNSGKSSIIQALLLLKQTLALPRPEVPLHLEGYVDALNLRELTYGWPGAEQRVPGPRIGIRWSSVINELRAAGVAQRNTTVEMFLDYEDVHGQIVLTEIRLTSSGGPDPLVVRRQPKGDYVCVLPDSYAKKVRVQVDHFLPYLLPKDRLAGQLDADMDFNTHVIAEALDDLRALLSRFMYLGSMRFPPPALYRPVTVPPQELGPSGEYAAQMLYARRSDQIHYLPPVRIDGDNIHVPGMVRSRSLVDAINDVLITLGIESSVRVEDVADIGFRLLFGQASLQHVGRGLSYLLPVIELGLIADPLRFDAEVGDLPLADYEKACPYYTHSAIEEGEAHLHPKVQTRLAHWLVSLAMARRQMIVETHSDHLVRRLRGLAARAKAGSDLEKWLLDNVRILHVEQQPDGQSTVKSERLTPLGMIEGWPADFMDEATDEERAIYDASLDKTPVSPLPDIGEVEHDVGEEPDLGP